MYLRFVVSKIDKDSEREQGLFQAIADLRARGKLSPHEEQLEEEIRGWFEKHLAQPSRFSSSKPPNYRKKWKGLSWFKSEAKDHVDKMRAMAAILEQHGIPVKMLKAKRVGRIVYEDDHQVVAEPFSDTPL